MRYIATITKDHLHTPWNLRVGDAFWGPATYDDDGRAIRPNVEDLPTHTFKLYDIDAVAHYEGTIQADADGLDAAATRLWEWGMYDSGTVSITIDNVQWI